MVISISYWCWSINTADITNYFLVITAGNLWFWFFLSISMAVLWIVSTQRLCINISCAIIVWRYWYLSKVLFFCYGSDSCFWFWFVLYVKTVFICWASELQNCIQTICLAVFPCWSWQWWSKLIHILFLLFLSPSIAIWC